MSGWMLMGVPGPSVYYGDFLVYGLRVGPSH